MKFTWDEIDRHLLSTYDLFICSASYEERCLSFLRNCPTGRLKESLICSIEEYDCYVSENLALMKEILTEKKIKYSEVVLSHRDPITSTDKIISKLNHVLSEKGLDSVLIDLTTFTHEMLLILLRMFHDLFPSIKISFVYSNAGNYDQRKSETKSVANSKWLSKGIAEIRSIIGYPGSPQPMNRTHLLIVVGYEYDRALSIISEIEPASLSLAFGKSDSITTEHKSDDKHYGAKEHFDKLTTAALAYFPEDRFHKFEISCDNPTKTRDEIESHLHSIEIDKYRHNIVIFALNNKPSTLGVGLWGIENDNAQLCYAPALIYNYENYSTTGNYCYFFENIFSKIK